ncbi:hypothetical protein AMS68_002228 [Peltaster fructicola]|uniref:FAD/NAD(P)-binding domain-containing protein n=1 Tax=Peltaster fructicola TaxID=286661 RepID=A0A6H0XPY3_9PEZI|nr:hypothetical protein AMS68_002228 [Peltaster fructicola]
MAWQPYEKNSNTSFDVVIVGAGISGINFAYRLQERHPELSYAILEGRHEIGGTWSLFQYPGIRSDSDLYTFGFKWRPWNDKGSIAKGDLIQRYVKESAEMYHIDEKIHFHHKVRSADYSTSDKLWSLDVDANGQSKTFKARFMLLGTGYYNYDEPLETVIPGIDTFKGTVVHPQFWPADLDYTDKDVVVIGSGATAVTVLPVMAKTAKHVTMLQRSPGYIVSIPSEDGLEKLVRFVFGWWPAAQHLIFRLKWIWASFYITTLSALIPKIVRAQLLKRVTKVLPPNIPVDPHFTPKYNPWEQRMCLCPDGDFFDGLKSGRASVETGIIDTITPNSIKLKSGAELHPDIIVTATGLKLQFAGGIKISVDNKALNLSEKFIWKGLMIEDLPNAAFSFGYVDASWTLGADASAQLICRLVATMKQEGVVEVTPRRSELEKQTLQPKNLLRLNSTYVEKASSVTPKAGDRGQWIPRTHYMRDLWNAKFGDIRTSLDWVKA